MKKGQVIVYNSQKGYGLIKDDIEQMLYLAVSEDCLEPISTGDIVCFLPFGILQATKISPYNGGYKLKID